MPEALAFDRKAGAYNDHAHVQRDTAAWVAEWLPAHGRHARCFEFGAGTGNFTRYLCERFATIEASDIAPHMLEQGRQALPHVNWVVQDAWQPTVPAESVDCVASCSLLQWADDPVAVLQRWHRLLKPSGTLISGIYISPSLPELGSLLDADRQFLWRSAAEWERCVTAAGFKIVRCETTLRRYSYPSALVLLRRLHGTGAIRLGRPLSTGEVKKLIEEYQACYAVPEGVMTTWTFLRIEAVK